MKKGVWKNNMKKSIYWLAISAFIMLVLPWLVVTFVTNDAGMIATIILFFAVNPLYFIIMGAFAGENVKTLWWIPVFSAIFFLAGAWIFFAMGELSIYRLCTCLCCYRDSSYVDFCVFKEKSTAVILFIIANIELYRIEYKVPFIYFHIY